MMTFISPTLAQPETVVVTQILVMLLLLGYINQDIN